MFFLPKTLDKALKILYLCRKKQMTYKIHLSKNDMRQITSVFNGISTQMIRLALNFKQNGLNARLVRNYALNHLSSATFVEA